MPDTVSVKPELLRWAVERSGLPFEQLIAKMPNLDLWLTGEKDPTLTQLEQFAKRTMTPFGYLFLAAPPLERLPIPDFRTRDDKPIRRLSPNLLDTVGDMQRRQDWMRDYLLEQGQRKLDYIGSVNKQVSAEALANRMRQALHLASDWTEEFSRWEETLSKLRQTIENIGVMVATSGIVGLNTRRKLEAEEFRGFVLCDDVAPLIFVNGADAKSAQMFTLAHELAHLWLGKDGLFNLIGTMPADDDAERLCNQAAAEFLVPARKVQEQWPEVSQESKPFHRLARLFKVSPIVTARRALDLRLINKERFFAFYNAYLQEMLEVKNNKESGGGDFYLVQDVRLGRRFASAVVQAVREGQLLYREAYQLTGLKGDTFERYAAQVTTRTRGRTA